MERNNKKDNHILVIMYIIIILVILSVVFIVFISNNKLLSNVIDTTNNETTTENKDAKSENNKDEVDKTNNKDKNTATPTVQEKKDQAPITTQPTESQIATYTTTLYDKEQTRIENINLAISKLNGVIIENGSEFSFNNTIGPMDESNGFKKATGFDSNGKKIKISGGGICQISSTLYNSALIAGFEITERHPHSRRVYYVPKDKDATIFYGSLDLKFINNSGSKVRIDASATNSTVTITLTKIA